ncbi:TPA: hypothetical protein IHN82_004887, partial [Escherichia coli]|nr:hypothetical protein [Escherichia coli]
MSHVDIIWQLHALQTSRLTTFARRRQRSPRLFTVEAFQTHLEGREWHIDTVGMEAS